MDTHGDKCYSCFYRRVVPGSVHTKCLAPWKNNLEHPQADDWPKERGWWTFPLNFDPVWMKTECKRFKPKEE